MRESQGASFEGMRPWSPASEIVESVVDGTVIDLHNECRLMEIGFRITSGLPVITLAFRRNSGDGFEIQFWDVLDLTLVQDPDDWFVYAQRTDPTVEPDYATFLRINYAVGPHGLSRFAVNSVLGTLNFKAKTVSWVSMMVPPDIRQ